jgi:hypothetical protein
MPVISMFFGLIVRMFYRDNKQHKLPHIHVEYQNDVAVFSIPDGELLAGSLPTGKMKLVRAWIEIYQDDLMADWKLAVEGQEVYKIDGLR